MTNARAPERLVQLAKDLRILMLDVDGVLTDGGIILIGRSEEAKRFNVHDGMGITLARSAGIQSGIITSRNSEVVDRRAKELGIDQVFQGVQRKPDVLDIILEITGIQPSQIAFIGDDIQDVSIMKRIGLPIAVQNAVPLVKEACLYVTDKCGGHGAVREAVDWLLDLRGDKDAVYAKFTDA